jgi:TPR repeat protein
MCLITFDFKEAAKCYKKAADQGHSKALCRAGLEICSSCNISFDV